MDTPDERTGELLPASATPPDVGVDRRPQCHAVICLSSGQSEQTTTASGALGGLGALLALVVAYTGLGAGYSGDLGKLGHIPVVHLGVAVLGLPLLAAAGGWLLAGREPPAIARQPLG